MAVKVPDQSLAAEAGDKPTKIWDTLVVLTTEQQNGLL